MWPKLPNLASLAQNFAHSSFSSLVHSLLPKDNIFKNILNESLMEAIHYKIWKKTDYNVLVRETCRGGHFYSLLAYRLTEKTVFKLEREFDDDMKFGKIRLKMT